MEDRADQGYEALDKAIKDVQAEAANAPELAGVFSGYKISTRQLSADLNRTKAAQLGIDVQEVFDTMQIYLGSLYINDFNMFGRTYQVIAQADKQFRSKPSDIIKLQTRNSEGRMVQLGSIVRVSETTGPDNVMRYNAFRSADLKKLTYQQILSGNTALLVFPLCVLLVFLVLSAQYESLFLPNGGVLEAARLRLRPILMTSLAFIMGVVHLVFSSGAQLNYRYIKYKVWQMNPCL